MKAVTFDPVNDQFTLTQQPIPQLAHETDVLIKTVACGLNPVDAKIHLWKGMVPNMDESWVPGLDVVGVIEDVGAKVEKFKAGDLVFCHGNMLRPHGGFAEYTIQDSNILLHAPDVDNVILAATPCAGWTAWRALVDKLKIGDRTSILITGGSGGVGGFAVQIAKLFDVNNIIATCSAKNMDYVKSLGAHHVIDYKTEDVVETVKQLTDELGVEVGFDTVGPDNDIIVANSLGFDGQMVEIVDVVRPSSYNNAFLMGLGFHQLSLGAGHGHGKAGQASITFAGQQFTDALTKGQIIPPKIKTVDINALPQELTQILEQRTVGKVVLTF